MSKNPQLVARLEEREAQRDAVREIIKPIEAKRSEVRKQLDSLQEQDRKLGEEIAKLEKDGNLRDVCNEIAALRRALSPNRKSLKAEAGEYGTEGKPI